MLFWKAFFRMLWPLSLVVQRIKVVDKYPNMDPVKVGDI